MLNSPEDSSSIVNQRSGSGTSATLPFVMELSLENLTPSLNDLDRGSHNSLFFQLFISFSELNSSNNVIYTYGNL